ncbi:hypothetical protein M885DRAFT_541852 [Pelagophyceae sp. CCMP2097]|nr:hypothetical protein M885DRAFT_541852 [Pelagophyceae sp. CCMP2097]
MRLAAALALLRLCCAAGAPSTEVVWDFEDLGGWADAAATEMSVDVGVRGGNLHGSVRGGNANLDSDAPHLDSPPLLLSAAGRQMVVLRMKYQSGSAKAARWRARYGVVAPRPGSSGDAGRADWRVHGEARLRVVSTDAAHADALDDGDLNTTWLTNAGGSAVFSWTEGEVGAESNAGSFAVTELLLVSGPSPPRSVALSSAAAVGGPWTVKWQSKSLNATPGATQHLDASSEIWPDDVAAFWKVSFPDGSVDGLAVTIAELRVLPAVVEARFGLAASPDFVTYAIPLWRRAAVAALGADSPSPALSTYLTHLRLYVGDDVLGAEPRRFYDERAAEACKEWASGSDAGSQFWRLLSTDARSGPWVVSEIAMFEDPACSAGLSKNVDAGRGNVGAVASSWAGASTGGVLYDGKCGSTSPGGVGNGAWTSGAYAEDDREKGGTWVGLIFERDVAVRCVTVCQSEDSASRAANVILQRSDDAIAWTDHASLVLPAAVSVAVADPCLLSYEPKDFGVKAAGAYDRSAKSLKAGGHPTSGSALSRDAFEIDFIRVSTQPVIRHVTGCVDQFWPSVSARLGAAPQLPLLEAVTALKDTSFLENGFLARHYAETALPPAAAYAKTFGCPVDGGVRITILGDGLGSVGEPSTVTVGGNRCENVEYDSAPPGLECTLPAAGLQRGAVDVVVSRADVPQLFDSVQYLAYQTPPAQMQSPTISNVAAHSLDLTWFPPGPDSVLGGTFWGALPITGYVVSYRQAPSAGDTFTRAEDDAYDSAFANDAVFTVALGNVTTTTIIGLRAATWYNFAITAASEDRWADAGAVDAVDLYGRRLLLDHALMGQRSVYSNATSTLENDVSFNFFDANSTVNHGASDKRATAEPSGLVSGEWSHGFVFIGDANIENCNASISCCDGFDTAAYAETGRGCLADAYVCFESSVADFFVTEDLGDVSKDSYNGGRKSEARNDPNSTDNRAAKRISKLDDLERNSFQLPIEPSAACGPTLRLTPSAPRATGAVWYARRLNVREGFESTFVLRASNPSTRCDFMDGAYTHCRSRGADGFAFVLQEERFDALGSGGAGLGYEGISNSMAVEFDTFYNAELIDSFENHVSIHSNGKSPNSAHHSKSFAATTNIPDLSTSAGSDHEHVRIKIVYDPIFDSSFLSSPAWQTTPQTAHFFTNGDFLSGGLADFGYGIGTLSVYVDDFARPVLVTPLNIDALLKLHHGRAYVGFTAATGQATYQTHDLLEWRFSSTRRDPKAFPPPRVNEGGAHA